MQLPTESPAGRAADREALLRSAIVQVETSLRLERERGDRIGEAAALAQLGILRRLLDERDIAERHLLEALAIYEPLSHPEAAKLYANLEDIAEARADTEAVAAWRAKKDATLAALSRPEADAAPPTSLQLVVGTHALAQLAYAHRRTEPGVAPPPQLAEQLAGMRQGSGPFPAIAAFLDTVARGAPVPPVPPDLPADLAQLLQSLRDQLAGEEA